MVGMFSGSYDCVERTVHCDCMHHNTIMKGHCFRSYAFTKLSSMTLHFFAIILQVLIYLCVCLERSGFFNYPIKVISGAHEGKERLTRLPN